MKILCGSCQNEILLEDSKVPEGVFKIKCPKCGKLVTAQRGTPPQTPTPAVPSGEAEKISSAVEAYLQREIAAAKNEIMSNIQTFFRGGFPWKEGSASMELAADGTPDRKALVCHDDLTAMGAVSGALKSMRYLVETTSITAEALKKLEMGIYQAVIVNHALADDKEGGRKIIGRINGWKPLQRRQTFLVLVSPHVKTSDSNQAFFHGVNMTVHLGDLANLEALMREGQRYYQQMYHTFNRVLAKSEERL